MNKIYQLQKINRKLIDFLENYLERRKEQWDEPIFDAYSGVTRMSDDGETFEEYYADEIQLLKQAKEIYK